MDGGKGALCAYSFSCMSLRLTCINKPDSLLLTKVISAILSGDKGYRQLERNMWKYAGRERLTKLSEAAACHVRFLIFVLSLRIKLYVN